MKAALVRAYGAPASVIGFSDSHQRPALPKAQEGTQQKDLLLVKVQACSLSPGDIRTIKGEKAIITKSRHAHGFPYIPGGDICGTVVETSGDAGDFAVGDSVVSTWDMFGEGGMAEYAIVERKFTVRKPPAISAVEGAALANSAGHALMAVERAGVAPGHRVLVLGGGGGVGTMAIQFARKVGAAYIAATCTDVPLMASLGVDRTVDHTVADVWGEADFKAQPFDVVIDCAVGTEAWQRARSSGVLKRRGTFVAVVLNTWEIDVSSYFAIAVFLLRPLMRQLVSALSFGPRYKMYVASVTGAVNERVMAAVREGSVHAVVDAKSPLPLTQAGVTQAFVQHEQRKGHGKIVVEVSG